MVVKYVKIVYACDCLHLKLNRIDSNDHIPVHFSAHNSFARKTTTEISIYDASWVRRRVQYYSTKHIFFTEQESLKKKIEFEYRE